MRPPFVLGLLVALAGPARAGAHELAPDADAQFQISEVLSGRSALTDFRFLPDGRMVLAEREGRIWVRSTAGGLIQALDISVLTDSGSGTSGREKGLLGLAVHPDFASNGLLFLFYTRGSDNLSSSQGRVSTFRMQGDFLNAASETVIVDGLSAPDNHNGGGLEAGTDGFLYISVGDTGCEAGNFFATCLTNPSGKVLRVDLSGTVPSSNPLVGRSSVAACADRCMDFAPNSTGAPRLDIFAWGFRDPRRLWLDPQTQRLWASDIGADSFDEINIVKSGRHYGWPFREGASGQAASKCGATTAGSGDCVDPLFSCPRDGADPCAALIVGEIIDSCAWPVEWQNHLVVGDTESQRLWTLPVTVNRDGLTSVTRIPLATTTGGPTAMRMGPDERLYISLDSGRMVSIRPLTPSTVCALPDGGTAPSDGGRGNIGGPGRGTGGAVEPVVSCGGCSTGASGLGAVALLGGLVLSKGLRRRPRP